MMDERLLTTSQIADKLQVTEKTVTRWLLAGSLKGYKVGRQWRVREDDLEAFMKASASK